MNVCRLLPIFIILLFGTLSYADVKLPALASDNMVLQQNSEFNIWGWAEPDDITGFTVGTLQIVGMNSPMKDGLAAQKTAFVYCTAETPKV